MTVHRFRKRPTEVTAVLWTGAPLDDVEAFTSEAPVPPGSDAAVRLNGGTLWAWNHLEEQWLKVPVGHWLVLGVKGELYPCDPEVMAAVADDVTDNATYVPLVLRGDPGTVKRVETWSPTNGGG